MASTLTVRGQRVSNQSQRKYLVVIIRPTPVTTPAGTYVAFARIEKRTDSLDTARRTQRNYDNPIGCLVLVIDRTTGEEV